MLALPCPDTRGRAAGSGIALCRPTDVPALGTACQRAYHSGDKKTRKAFSKIAVTRHTVVRETLLKTAVVGRLSDSDLAATDTRRD